MIQSLKPGLLSILFFLLCLNIPAVMAQDDQSTQGNIIREITLSVQGNDSILVIKGTLDAKQLASTAINHSKRSKKFSIAIQNALIDPEYLSSSFISFPVGNDVENIQILEDTIEEGDTFYYMVNLEVLGRKILLPEVIQPIRENELKIRLKDYERLQRQAQAKKMEEERLKRQEEERIRKDKQRQLELQQKLQAELRKKEEEEKKQKEKEEQAHTAVEQILKHYHKPSIMQVSILNASGKSKRAYKLSVFLGNLEKKNIEESLGIKLDIVNISNAMNVNQMQTTVYFRENFLKSALFLAQLIPGEQKIMPMKNQNERVGVDIEIYIGRDYK